MKEGWSNKLLGEILSLEYGKPLPKSDRTVNGKYPVYGANGIKAMSNKYYFDQPTLIIGRKGSAGEINYSEKKFWPLDVTYFVNYDKDTLDLDFLFHLLTISDLPSLAKGVKPGINRNEVYSIQASIPPLPEQQQIVSILDQAFAAIDQARANVERNLQNAKELFQSKLNAVFSQRGEGWEEKRLWEVNRFIDYRGKTPKKTPEGIRLITAKNVRMGYLKREPEEFISPQDYDGWMTRGIPEIGDVLFTTEAPLANVAILNTSDRVALAQRIITLCPNRELLSGEYLHYCLQSRNVQNKILEKGTGATVTGIKSRLLKEIVITIPTHEKQQLIVNVLDRLKQHVNNVKKKYEDELDLLVDLKKSLLQKAFTGKLTTKPIPA